MKKICPRCKAALVERTNKNNGNAFLGCSKFPKCKYTQSIYTKVGDEDLYPHRPDDSDYPEYPEYDWSGDWKDTWDDDMGMDPMDFGDN